MALRLTEGEVAQVPTHPSLAVLLEFPVAITDYAGRGFTEDPAAVAGDFFLRWGAGDSYLAVSPLVEGARGVLHVITAGRSYAVAFFPAPPDQAWAKVRFEALGPAGPGDAAAATRVERLRRSPSPRPPSTDREAWLGVLDLLELADRLSEGQRGALLRSNPALTHRRLAGALLVSYGRIHLQSALRNDDLDTLALRFTLENTSDRPRRWRTASLRVRVGERVYTPVLHTVEPWLPAGGKGTYALVLAGDGFGGRHRLSVDNDFRISLAEADPGEDLTRPTP